MDARAAAHFVFGMCQDVDNHAFIMKDSTVLSSIQGFLRSNDPECMRKAMKVQIVGAVNEWWNGV
jgi:hypothetical protein